MAPQNAPTNLLGCIFPRAGRGVATIPHRPSPQAIKATSHNPTSLHSPILPSTSQPQSPTTWNLDLEALVFGPAAGVEPGLDNYLDSDLLDVPSELWDHFLDEEPPDHGSTPAPCVCHKLPRSYCPKFVPTMVEQIAMISAVPGCQANMDYCKVPLKSPSVRCSQL